MYTISRIVPTEALAMSIKNLATGLAPKAARPSCKLVHYHHQCCCLQPYQDRGMRLPV